MFKLIKIAIVVVLIVGLCNGVGLLKDKIDLKNNVIRLHVVANSDAQTDQIIKLQVKDAIISYLQPMMKGLPSTEEAKAFLQDKLADLQAIADGVLERAGVSDRARVTLTKEAFETRHYDTFSLPAGVYDALRVEIGEGNGKNWWCVVFPSLCMPNNTQSVRDTAVSAGFDNRLSSMLTGEETYELRFYLLECIGKLENFFFEEL